MSDDMDRLNALINTAAVILAGAYGTDTGSARCQVLRYVDAALEAAALSDAIIWRRSGGQVPRGIMNAGRVYKRAAFHASLSAACARRLHL